MAYSLRRGAKQELIVADRFVSHNDGWRFAPDWVQIPSSVEQLSEMQDVDFLLNNVRLTGTLDRWFWGEKNNEPMSVASVKEWIKDGTEVRRDHGMWWESWIPTKVNLFVWRAEMDRIPTKDALIRRNISIQDGSCPMCDYVDETVMHLFTGCVFAHGVWLAVGRWCRAKPIVVFDFTDLLGIHDQFKDKWSQRIIRGIVYTSCWVIWKFRNAKVFNNAAPSVVDAVAWIKSWSFLWLKNRSKFARIEWKDWSCNPLYMM
ncbi:putative reverse transcriptase zinc-binding domain-containing protein [Helianthus annuus]|uniref:Reverse transcriptase zinc-binding domain-containing protein n=2 Tax=Helianthus annuus TaxID=4232 RepID=A0A9K3N1E6_HELAN|nr:putative reverse transcriptase zinc-binding domain-containing protein [Helianthus annuus]